MHPDIKKLLEVQRVDRTLASIRRDLTSLPEEEQRRRQQLDKTRQRAEAAQAELQRAEVESRAQEKGIQAADEEIKKLQGRLNTVKNNAEYQATLFQIEAVKKEQSSIEEEGVELLDKLETMRAEVERLKAALTDEEATFAKFLEEASTLRAEREGELAKAGEGRDAMLADISRDALERYSSLFDVRDGEAVCAVEGEVCTGCYTRVTPNDLARLMGASSIVQCGSCQRMLYLADG